jgi:hypothetical protein
MKNHEYIPSYVVTFMLGAAFVGFLQAMFDFPCGG